MQTKKPSPVSAFFNRFSNKVIRLTGNPYTFIGALAVLIIWAVTGPLFGFSDTWQLVINTATSLITFLMVFVIQQSQNKDTMALQLKLNELIASNQLASNRLIGVEDLTEEELEVLKKFYVKLIELAKKDSNLHKSHSIDEAMLRHKAKVK